MGANALVSRGAANQVANAGKDAAVSNALGAGYKLPPTEINPSITNSLLEGLSGKIKTSQAASAKNQPITNQLAAKAVGAPVDAPLTAEALQGIRKSAGQAYEAIKGTGTVAADAPYTQALDTIAQKYQGAAQGFPGLVKDDIPKMIESLKQPNFDAAHAVDAISVLREGANKAFAAGDTAMGKASKDAASAMEGMLERHLTATGQDPALLKSFVDARQTIAKTYSVEKALNAATGDVSAKVLANQLAKGRPLSGELKTIAEVGGAFPKATQSLPQNYNASSPLDYMGAVVGGVKSGNPLATAAAILAARPAVRGVILSGPYQKLAASGDKYAPNALVNLLSSQGTPARLLGQARLTAGGAINRANGP
jgi:hypothetical protein